MQSIHLPRGTWDFEETRPLAPAGGFGQVFEGTTPDGTPVAVKRLAIDAEAAGRREIRIVDALVGQSLPHVVPIHDAGLDADSGRYFLVMARADRSLRDELRSRSNIPEAEARAILEAIALGLQEITDVVHRDLKPDNVLMHEGTWKLADLGIARFAEEATSTNTMRDCLSPAYASPEQWRGEHATHATDVYAAGCIGFELLSGRPPFMGPTNGDFMAQHLNSAPPVLEASPQMQLLLGTCLRKPPAARPTIAGFLSRLRAIPVAPPTIEGSKLVAAAAAVEQRRAEEDALRNAQENREERRRELGLAGAEELRAIMDELFARVERESQGTARRIVRAVGRVALVTGSSVQLGRGELGYFIPFPILPEDAFPRCRWNVAAGAVITVKQSGGTEYAGRGANLWYGDFDGLGAFRWYEQSYMFNAWGRRRAEIEPFGVIDVGDLDRVDEAQVMIATLQRASPLRPIDGEGLEAFCRRWIDRLAEAAVGSLSRPSSMPDEPV